MSIAEDTKSVVGAYYPAGLRGELPAFSPHLAAEFSVTAPANYLPWGGTHLGKACFDDVLHHLPETLDFSRFRYDSFTAEGTHGRFDHHRHCGYATHGEDLAALGSQRRYGAVNLGGLLPTASTAGPTGYRTRSLALLCAGIRLSSH